MTREGQYSWDLDIGNMRVDEIDALITACNRYRRAAKVDELYGRLNQILIEIDELGCRLETPISEDDKRWTTVTPDSCFIKQKPKTELNV